jgi:pyridoxine 4-dehydrogenase
MQLARCADEPYEVTSILRRAIDLGVNHIDTADFYGDGFLNKVVGETLGNMPGIVIATKVGAEVNPGGSIPLRPAQRPEQHRASVEANLRSLGLEQLPLVNLRRLDVAPGISAHGDQAVDLDDQLATLVALRDADSIGAIGLSAVSFDGLKQAIPAGIA